MTHLSHGGGMERACVFVKHKRQIDNRQVSSIDSWKDSQGEGKKRREMHVSPLSLERDRERQRDP